MHSQRDFGHEPRGSALMPTQPILRLAFDTAPTSRSLMPLVRAIPSWQCAIRDSLVPRP
jgi:hypothetical protein